MRTYKVVPLSQRSGILEWCENTLPLKDFLVGQDNKSGAHLKYRPQDLTGRQAREEFKTLQRAHPPNDPERAKSFVKLCRRFQVWTVTNFSPVSFFCKN